MFDETSTQGPASPAPTDPSGEAGWAEVAAFLGDPRAHDGVDAVQRIDTHAAVVFLAGPRAYKIKRPVAFPYLDFSTPARREAACRREIAIDRPIAPDIYRRVVAITREADGSLALGGDGVPVEWAVEMNRFDESATLDRVLAKGPLAPTFVDDLADAVAQAEARTGVRDAGPWIADLGAYIGQNDDAFAERPDLFDPLAATRLAARARARLADLTDLLTARGRRGLVRLGHGDLHAGNVAVVDGQPQLFDAIEFDDAIATGDVLYDAGFLVMDLDERGDPAAACRLLNRLILETTRRESLRRGGGAPSSPEATARMLLCQVDGLAALPLFLSVRAALRAKIAASRSLHLDGAPRRLAEGEARRLFATAIRDLEPETPRLVAVGGLSGSGKSTLAQGLATSLAPAPGALVLRTDVIRKLLAGVVATTRLGPEHYTRAASDRVYDLIGHAASRGLAAGRSVIVDAVATDPAERADFAAIAAACEVPFTGLWLDVDARIAMARVSARTADASDADAAVVAFQRRLALGDIDWHRLDGNGAPAGVLAAARRVLAGDVARERSA